jgi:glycerol-3-phosphate acyltransferase PlsY
MDSYGLLAIAIAYVLGCFNASYYFVHWKTGADIRGHGSGNAGARNVGRLLGTTAFFVTFLLDGSKGALAAVIGTRLSSAPTAPEMCAIAAVAGHVWPIQLGWRGGKGIATSMGAVLALAFLGARSGFIPVLCVLTLLLIYTHRHNLSRWCRRVAGISHRDSTS